MAKAFHEDFEDDVKESGLSDLKKAQKLIDSAILKIPTSKLRNEVADVNIMLLSILTKNT